MAGIIQQVNINTIGMGLIGVGGTMVTMSIMPPGGMFSPVPPGFAPSALAIGGMGVAAVGFAFSIVQAPKQ